MASGSNPILDGSSSIDEISVGPKPYDDPDRLADDLLGEIGETTMLALGQGERIKAATEDSDRTIQLRHGPLTRRRDILKVGSLIARMQSSRETGGVRGEMTVSSSFWTALALTVAATLLSSTAEAENGRTRADQRGTWSFVIENDVFGGTDRNYTNGLRLGYLTGFRPVEGISGFAAKTLLGADPEDGVRQSFALGHSIFTPEDTELEQAPADQHPYAGWLYGEYALLAESPNTIDQLYLQLGIVGPSAQGEWVQNNFHDLIGVAEAEGWSDQLEDEPGILIGYNKKLRNLIETPTLGLGVDLAPDVGFSLGNVLTEASAGVTLRAGTNLGGDYGPPRIRPSLAGAGFFAPAGAFSAYVFAGVQGRAVARNIFLDGNSFKNSASVDKKYFVADFQAGLVVQIKDVQLAYTFVTRTKEFETQDERQTFGALSLSFKF